MGVAFAGACWGLAGMGLHISGRWFWNQILRWWACKPAQKISWKILIVNSRLEREKIRWHQLRMGLCKQSTAHKRARLCQEISQQIPTPHSSQTSTRASKGYAHQLRCKNTRSNIQRHFANPFTWGHQKNTGHRRYIRVVLPRHQSNNGTNYELNCSTPNKGHTTITNRSNSVPGLLCHTPWRNSQVPRERHDTRLTFQRLPPLRTRFKKAERQDISI